MIELTLSMFAWLGVVMIQIMVHYWVSVRHRLDKLSPEDDIVSPLLELEESLDDILTCNTSIPSGDGVNDPAKILVQSISESIEEDEQPLDGDEPQLFFRLLDQTGEEMIESCHSIEDLVKEQINKIDQIL